MNGDDWVEKYHQGKAETGKKYDPTQPRVPAGTPTGGQWTEGGGSWGRAAIKPRGGGRWGQGFGRPPVGPAGPSNEKVTREYFTDGPGKEIVAGLEGDMREKVIGVLSDAKIPKRYIENLTAVSTDPPEATESSSWEDEEYIGAMGFYDPQNKSIHVQPITLMPVAFETGMMGLPPGHRTLAHELGHHITLNEPWQSERVGSFTKLEIMEGAWGAFEWGWESRYADMGLREYSLTNLDEFMGDCWLVYQFGEESQKNALAQELDSINILVDINSLDDIFGG